MNAFGLAISGRAISALAASMALVACGSTTAVDSTTSPTAHTSTPQESDLDPRDYPEVVMINESEFPMGDVENWLSWGDLAIVATVDSEADSLDQEEPTEVPEYFIHRDLTLTVESVLWTFPQTDPGVSAGQQLTVFDLGWNLHDGVERRPLRAQGTDRLEVGGKYLVVLYRRDARTWRVVGDVAQLRIDPGGRIIAPAGAELGGAKKLAGRHISELRTTFAATRLDPEIASKHDIPAEERVSVIERERDAAGPDDRP